MCVPLTSHRMESSKRASSETETFKTKKTFKMRTFETESFETETGTFKTESFKTESSETESLKMESSKTGSFKTETSKTECSIKKSSRTESSKTENRKTEISKTVLNSIARPAPAETLPAYNSASPASPASLLAPLPSRNLSERALRATRSTLHIALLAAQRTEECQPTLNTAETQSAPCWDLVSKFWAWLRFWLYLFINKYIVCYILSDWLILSGQFIASYLLFSTAIIIIYNLSVATVYLLSLL